MNYIAFDCHRRYTFRQVKDPSGRRLWEGRVPHRRDSCFVMFGVR